MKPFVRLVFVLLLAAAGLARAQSVLPTEAQLRALLGSHVAAATPGLTRNDIQFLPLVRAELAPCARTETFLPPGLRPWGRLAVGVRCADGAAWTVMVPAQVRVWGTALVAQVPLAAGAIPGTADVAEQEVELSREQGGLLREVAQLGGRALVRPLAAGQVVRADQLRSPTVVQAGESVHLRIVGNGFAITSTGQALAAAAEGQPVRVRTEFGRILTGVAREGRSVDIEP